MLKKKKDLPVLVEKEMDLDRDRGALTQTSRMERSTCDPLGSIYALGLECDVRMMGILMGKSEKDLKKKNTESKMRQRSRDLVFELKSRFMKVMKSDGRSS